MDGRKACYCSSLLVLSLLAVAFGLGTVGVGGWLMDAVANGYSNVDAVNDVLEAEQDGPLDVTNADSGLGLRRTDFPLRIMGTN
jgi:hypothetical protein